MRKIDHHPGKNPASARPSRNAKRVELELRHAQRRPERVFQIPTAQTDTRSGTPMNAVNAATIPHVTMIRQQSRPGRPIFRR